MTFEERFKLSETANKLIDKFAKESDRLLEESKLEEAQKENHKALGALELTRVLLNEMESMQ